MAVKVYLRLMVAVVMWMCVLPMVADVAPSYDSIVERNAGKGLAELTRLGYRSLELGRYDEALALYMLATSKGDDSLTGADMREYIKVYNNIGYIYLFDRNNPERAYPYFLHARRLAEATGEDDLLGAIFDNIAKIHDDFGDADKAIDMYNLAMTHAARADTEVSAPIQLMVLNDMVNCAMANDMTDRIGASLDIFAGLPEYSIPMGRYSKEMCRALQQLLQGRIREATYVADHAGRYIDSKVDSARYVTDHNLTMANIYHMRGMEDSARIYLDRALVVAERHQLSDRLPRIYRGMSVVEGARGDSVLSRKLRLLAYESDERLHSSKMYAALNTLEATQQIDDLNVRLRESDIRHSHRVTVIWILVVAIVLVGSLLTYIFIRNRHLAASHRELVARHRESLRAEVANARLRHEYEDTIAALRRDLEQCRTVQSDGDDAAGSQRRITLPVDDKERLRIIGLVNDIFEKSDEVYDSDFSLERLAELADTKPRYLSALLNDTMGKSFSVLLAEARVRQGCALLLSPEFKKTKTIESIAVEVGYRSRTHFTSVFKKITGVTPLQYVAMAR